MTDEQALLLSAIAAAQREMQQKLSDIAEKQKQIEALCAIDQEARKKSQEAYRNRQTAAQDEYRKSQEAIRTTQAMAQDEYRKSQEAYRERQSAITWSKWTCFVASLTIVALIIYIAWRVS